MASIQKRITKSGKAHYRVRIMVQGVTVGRTFHTAKEAKFFIAQATLCQSTRQEIFDANTKSEIFTLSKAIKEFSEQYDKKDRSIFTRLKYWNKLFGSYDVNLITTKMIRDQLKIMHKEKSGATCNRYKSALGSVYKFIRVQYDIENSPTKETITFSEPRGRTRFLNDSELHSLLLACANSAWDRLSLLVVMAIHTGARRGELIGIKWQDIDFNNRTVLLETTKNGNSRVLSLTADCIELLMEFRCRTGYIFPDPNRLKGRFTNFDFHWQKALKQARITEFRFHDLRHTHASYLAIDGRTLLEIGFSLGHTNLASTMRYSHLIFESKQTMLDQTFGSNKKHPTSAAN